MQFINKNITSYEKGLLGENCAKKLLLSKGFEIIGERLKTPYGEIDILAKQNNDIVAIEVKLRKNLDNSLECISDLQKKRIANSLNFIISERNEPFENYRIDVVCLDSVGRFEYIKNAFYLEEILSS